MQSFAAKGTDGTDGGNYGGYGGHGTLTIVKEIVDASGAVIDSTPAGWTFVATSSGLPDGSQTETTDGTGSVEFTVVTTGTATKVSVVEQQQSGYQLVKQNKLNAVCTGGKGSAYNAGSLGFSISIKSDQDVRCVVINRLEPPCITVSKTSDPVSGSVVAPGSIIAYTLTAKVDGGSHPASLTLTDDLSAVLDHAAIVGALTPSQGTAVLDGTNLQWTITAFDQPLTLTYSVRVNADAFGVQLTNVLLVPPNASCDGSCTTEHSTPCWTLSKTSDPASGNAVQPGSTIVYTLTATNDSSIELSGATATDDLSGVLQHADLMTPLPPGLTQTGTTLTWVIPTIPAGGSVTVSFSVTVHADASDVDINNLATPGPGGTCVKADGDDSDTPPCRTTHHVPTVTHHAPTVDLSIVKTHTTADGDVVDSGKGEIITYSMTVSNVGQGPATGVTVSDPLPAGLTFVADSGVGPEGWTITEVDGVVTATFDGAFASEDSAVLMFQAVVGTLARSGPTVPFPDVDNTACVTSVETDTNPADNCSTDKTKVKSIAVSTQALCVNDAPVVSYSVTPQNVAGEPTIALIWWTSAAYANRDPSIPASDQAALLADGASQVNYIPVPPGWVDGQTITGTQLWPGAGVDASGRGNAWPGWRQLSDGTWVLDPAAPFYDLRNDAVVEVRINPTTASTVAYPPPSTHCDPTTTTTTTSTGSNELASTGSDITGPLTVGGLLLSLGAAMLALVRRRRPGGAD